MRGEDTVFLIIGTTLTTAGSFIAWGTGAGMLAMGCALIVSVAIKQWSQ